MSEPLHFLDGLRCPACRILNVSFFNAASGMVECRECGQTSLSLIEVPAQTSHTTMLTPDDSPAPRWRGRAKLT